MMFEETISISRRSVRRLILAPVIAALAFATACASPPPPVAPTTSTTGTAAAAPRASYPRMAPIEEYLMPDRDAEIALARSAAPPLLAADATVLVLTRAGYEKAIEGKNGFVCLVDRAWQSDFADAEFWNPHQRSPVCLNAAAVRSVLPAQHRLTQLALSGLSKDEILARVKEAIAKQELGTPEIGSMSYMLSKGQYINDRDSHWQPHLMFYVPGDMSGPLWGANLKSQSAVYGGGDDLPGGGRMPWTIFFVPVQRWSDGTPALPHH